MQQSKHHNYHLGATPIVMHDNNNTYILQKVSATLTDLHHMDTKTVFRLNVCAGTSAGADDEMW